jgi:DNA-binding transcriptional LysR family regulator
MCAHWRRVSACVRLLNRTTRRLHLTEVGSNYYARCTSILADIDEAEAEANSLQATPRGLLRIAAPVMFGIKHLSPAVGDYMRPPMNFHSTDLPPFPIVDLTQLNKLLHSNPWRRTFDRASLFAFR